MVNAEGRGKEREIVVVSLLITSRCNRRRSFGFDYSARFQS